MADLDATLHERLASIVGNAHMLTVAAEAEPYVVDWRGRFRGRARAVVRPGNTAEVAAVVRVCTEVGVPVVPQGGNTGLCGGATPHDTGDEIVIALGRMNRLRAIDAANATITVEAGMPLATVQQHAAAAGLYFPLSLASEGSCTIGGNLSTNAGGTAVLRYGNARDLTLGLEIVLADGRVWDGLRGLRKDNTGYDLKQMFIGAEGTLGVVTAAVLKLFPASRTQVTALVAVPAVTAAVALLELLRSALSDRLTGFELVSGIALALSRKLDPALPAPMPGHAWYVLVQGDDNAPDSPIATLLESSLAAAAEAGVACDATIAQSAAQAARLWALRENISEAQRREGPNIKHDISLAVSSIPAFVDACSTALEQSFPGARQIIFGHLGDGNLHYNLSAPENHPAGDFLDHATAVNRIVHDLVARHGGSFSAEHGIGQLKREDLLRYKSDVEVDLMRAIKRALDPRGLLNPGKVL